MGGNPDVSPAGAASSIGLDLKMILQVLFPKEDLVLWPHCVGTCSHALKKLLEPRAP